MKNVLIVGSGGREHAASMAFLKSDRVKTLYLAPGNDGMFNGSGKVDSRLRRVDLRIDDPKDIRRLLKIVGELKINIVFIGPEKPLSLGVVDFLEKEGIEVVGPSEKAARLEGSKAFAKDVMASLHIPIPEYAHFGHPDQAKEYIKSVSYPVVVKADGLAAGKGSIVTQTKEEALAAVDLIMVQKKFGQAGNRVVIEKRLNGEEFSFFAFVDGKTVLPMAWARDYKAVFDGDKGLNTGGMGTYSPYWEDGRDLTGRVMEKIARPLVGGCLRKYGFAYKGILYIGGTFLKEAGRINPYVFEINVRMGDPEAQVIYPRLKTDLVTISEKIARGELDRLDKLEWDRRHYVCVCVTSGRTRGSKGWYKGYPQRYAIGKEIGGLDKISPETLVFHSGTRWDAKNKRFLTAGGRVLSVVGCADSLQEARAKTYREVKKIKFAGAHYRRDIADIAKKGARDQGTACRIEVAFRLPDARARTRGNQLGSKVCLTDVYTINKKLNKNQLEMTASMLTNPIVQRSNINKPVSPKRFTWAIEIGFLPGVTDNVGNTAQESIENLLDIRFENGEGVYTSQIVFILDDVSKSRIEEIVQNLHNPFIQKVRIKTFAQFKKDGGMGVAVPAVRFKKSLLVSRVNLNVSDRELVRTGKEGIKNPNGVRRGPLALSLDYMKVIRRYFNKQGRDPTDVELESLAQTWSEHCKHTIFADPIDEVKEGLYKTYIKGATRKIRSEQGNKRDFCVSVFTDNSGAVVFDDDYLVTHKVETHNSPSALDPFGGAVTGILGVNRDTVGFGLGAKPVANTYGFCLADPRDKTVLYRSPDLTKKMLSSRRIMEGVVEGVGTGSNCSGIPTPQGFVVFDPRYRGKPLVFVGTVGLIPRKINNKPAHLKKAQPKDLIVMIGGRVGLDGIHGATFSSEALDSDSPSGAVQIGDPITQKKLSDVVVKEARDQGLFNSITDNGAGGLSCSVAEMARESGGCRVYLDKVPLKYPGLKPWQIWVSESQERMTLAVTEKNWPRLSRLLKRRGVEGSVIGEFTRSGKCEVFYRQQRVVDIDLNFLHNGLPPRPMKTFSKPSCYLMPDIPLPDDLTEVFGQMLKRLNIAGFEFISRQYDHEVQGSSVIKPLQGKGFINGEATVVRPVLDSKKGVVLSQGICPLYGDIDVYHMSACAVDTAVRNAVAVGADLDHLALLDNFCWCSSDEPERLSQLKQAVKACYYYAVAYKTPFISGKDSMFNDFKGYDGDGKPIKISVPPTLLISSIGVIKDVGKVISLEAKFPGDVIYLLGKTHNELGGSEYYGLLDGGKPVLGGDVPKVDAVKNRRLYRDLSYCIGRGIVVSAQSVGRGGLAVALARVAMGGLLGLDVSLKDIPSSASRDDAILFSESQGRLVVTVSPENKKQFERSMRNNPFVMVGKVSDQPDIIIRNRQGKIIVKTSVQESLNFYKSTFKNY